MFFNKLFNNKKKDTSNEESFDTVKEGTSQEQPEEVNWQEVIDKFAEEDARRYKKLEEDLSIEGRDLIRSYSIFSEDSNKRSKVVNETNITNNNFYIVHYWKDNPTEEEMHPKPFDPLNP